TRTFRTRCRRRSVRRGEIYFVNLNPVQGREQQGHRPVLIVSNDVINARPLVVMAVPGTDAANVPRLYPTQVLVTAAETGLPVDTVFHCFQARALDPGRFRTGPVGLLPTTRWGDVEQALRYVFNL